MNSLWLFAQSPNFAGYPALSWQPYSSQDVAQLSELVNLPLYRQKCTEQPFLTEKSTSEIIALFHKIIAIEHSVINNASGTIYLRKFGDIHQVRKLRCRK